MKSALHLVNSGVKLLNYQVRKLRRCNRRLVEGNRLQNRLYKLTDKTVHPLQVLLVKWLTSV